MQMTNLQIELLKTFSFDLSEAQLLEIKSLLAQYFAERASDEMDDFVKENGWNDDTIRSLAGEHMRTNYE
ncbi:MAG: hypothetical protein KBD94_09080 [Pyrinomonadaceae bacterium]|nr:hypothetical protein [Pyrinomonadaceae bacterium]